MQNILEFVVGPLGAVVMLGALLATVAWQARQELSVDVGSQTVVLRGVDALAKVWVPLVVAAFFLTALRVVVLS